MSGATELGIAGAVGAAVTAFFGWLAQHQGLIRADRRAEDQELSLYRSELKMDLQKAEAELDALKTDRIKSLEVATRERLKLEERIAVLEHEKGAAAEKIASLSAEVEDLRAEVKALRRLIYGGRPGTVGPAGERP